MYSTSPLQSNLREHERIKVDDKVRIILSSGSKIDTVMTDISKGGIGISYTLAAEVGVEFEIQFSVLLGQEHVTISTRVTIVHVYFNRGGFHIGLRFNELNSSDEFNLFKFIESKINPASFAQNTPSSISQCDSSI